MSVTDLTEAKGTSEEKGSPIVTSSSSEPGLDDLEYVQGARLYLVLGALTVVFFLIMLDNTILATAIPYITDEFHSLLDVGWYGSAYQLACAALQPLTGRLYTRINSKWMFLTCLFVFEAGSALCGAAPSSTALILGRAIAGIGGAGLLNGSLIILNSCVPPSRQPAIVGILMGIGQLGIAFGPLLGGAFTQYVTWRWCFYINLPLGAVSAAAIVLIHIPDHIAKPPWRKAMANGWIEFDLVGFALFAPAVLQFFLALQYGGNQYAWSDSRVIGLLCGSGATLIVWLVWNYYRGDEAMVPVKMIKNRFVWVSCVVGTFTSGTVFVTAYYLPLYFQAVLTYSPFKSGVGVLPNILAQMLFTVVAGGMIQRVGKYPPFIILGSILNTVGCGLLGLLQPSTPVGQWVGYQILCGAGRGFAMSIPFLAVQSSLPKPLIPAAMSVLVLLQNLSAAVMIVISQTIFTNSLVALVPKYAPGVDVDLVVSAGTKDIRRLVPEASLPGVLLAYSWSLDRVFYFCAGIAAPPLVFGWLLKEKKSAKAASVETPSVETPSVEEKRCETV